MEQQGEARPRLSQRADRGDQGRVVPLVHDHRVGAIAQGVEVRIRAVGYGGELGIGVPVGGETGLAGVLQQVGQAPGALGLEGADLVAARDQLAQHAAQEVGVAVVPAGGERMGEVDQPHAAASCEAKAFGASRA